MSLKLTAAAAIPAETLQTAHSAYPKGNPYLTLRDHLGSIFSDEDFADLYPHRGRPVYPPWRLALVTIVQFRENLSDRQAAEAVRGRIDLKYLLGLPLADPGFDYSVLCEFRTRLLTGDAGEQLLERLLERCQEMKLLKPRGRQRTDATHVLAAVRQISRLELVAETLRAALNELAASASYWLQEVAPPEWFARYGRRIEEHRLPRSKAKREEYARMVGADGYRLLDLLEAPDKPAEVNEGPAIDVLRQVWRQNYTREESCETPPCAHFKTEQELDRAGDRVVSPYDTEARFCSRHGRSWIGYRVHLTETCDENRPRLITHVHTTPASTHESKCTSPIQEALADKQRAPTEHLVDSAYINADTLLSSHIDRGIALIGPPMKNTSWQRRKRGAYSVDAFEVDWDQETVRCPEGKTSKIWTEHTERGKRQIRVRFDVSDCHPCPVRSLCTRAKKYGRQLTLRPKKQQEALQAARKQHADDRALYRLRQGIESTFSQGVRAFSLRQTRYVGLEKTEFQHIATAAAINVDRILGWLEGRPLATTRVSPLTALAA